MVLLLLMMMMIMTCGYVVSVWTDVWR